MWSIFHFITSVTMMSRENVKDMKIVFIGGRDLHSAGGIESFMRNLSRELVYLNVTPVIYCESDHFGRKTLNGIEIISLKSLPSRFITKPILGLIATLHAVCFHHDAALFHYNAWPPSLSSWIPRLLGFTTVMQGHGLEWKRTKYSHFQRKIAVMSKRIFFLRNIIEQLKQSQEEFIYHAIELRMRNRILKNGNSRRISSYCFLDVWFRIKILMC